MMNLSKMAIIFKKALFPAIMTIISFVLFIGIYLYMTVFAIEPYYYHGLLFALPFICLGIVTFFTVKGKFNANTLSITTWVLIGVLSFAVQFAFVYLGFRAATTTTTQISKYERVLKLTGYPKDALTQHFPDKIPSNAKNIMFSYNPRFLQGGENFSLKFETDSDSVKKFADDFALREKTICKPNDSEAKNNGIFINAFSACGYENLPQDFTIYIINSKPYHTNDWNHGKLSLAAVSGQRNEVIFYAEDW